MNLTVALERDIKKNARWIKERIVKRLGLDVSLQLAGIDQPSGTIPQQLHFLPTTAFIPRTSSSHQTSSSSSTPRKSKRKRNSTTSTPVSNPNVYSRGRYIKMNNARKGRPTKFVVGVLLSNVEHCKKEKWNVQFGKTGCIQLLAKDFENAFPPGQRVLVNWQGAGDLSLGCVVVWDGGTRYRVWFDDDQRTYMVFGVNLSLSNAQLPKNFPKQYHSLINKDLSSTSSSSSSSTTSSASSTSSITSSSSSTSKKRKKLLLVNV